MEVQSEQTQLIGYDHSIKVREGTVAGLSQDLVQLSRAISHSPLVARSSPGHCVPYHGHDIVEVTSPADKGALPKEANVLIQISGHPLPTIRIHAASVLVGHSTGAWLGLIER